MAFQACNVVACNQQAVCTFLKDFEVLADRVRADTIVAGLEVCVDAWEVLIASECP